MGQKILQEINLCLQDSNWREKVHDDMYCWSARGHCRAIDDFKDLDKFPNFHQNIDIKERGHVLLALADSPVLGEGSSLESSHNACKSCLPLLASSAVDLSY